MSDIKGNEQIIELFELVSGESVNSYSDDQLPFLADYIQGQLDANEMCIDKLIKRIKELEEFVESLQLDVSYDMRRCELMDREW